MIQDKMNRLLNDQIGEETFSGYLYLAMAAWFESRTLKGFAHWMKVQAREELAHAMKFFNYLCEAGGKVELSTIAAPKKEWPSPLAVFEESLAHEKHITARIYGLLEAANAEKDYATASMLQWFVNEQVEEESNASEILEKLKMIGESKGGLLYQDKELRKRE
jgi:ferritin